MRKKKGVYITMRRVNRVVSAAVALCMAATMVAPVWAAAPTADAPYGTEVEYVYLNKLPMKSSAQDNGHEKADSTAKQAFDDNMETLWHSNYNHKVGEVDNQNQGTSMASASNPYWIRWEVTSDLNTPVEVAGLVYHGRKGSTNDYRINGNWTNVTIKYTNSAAGKNAEDSEWHEVVSGKLGGKPAEDVDAVASDVKTIGEYAAPVGEKRDATIVFPEKINATALKVEVKEATTSNNAKKNNDFATASEIDVIGQINHTPVAPSEFTNETAVDKEVMKKNAGANSYANINNDKDATAAFDNNGNTLWHSNYNNSNGVGDTSNPSVNNPKTIWWNVVNDPAADAPIYVNKLVYHARSNGDNKWKDIEILVTTSTRGKDAADGEWTSVYKKAVPNAQVSTVEFTPQAATAMKVKVTSKQGGGAANCVAASEIEVYQVQKNAIPTGASLTLDGGVIANVQYKFSDAVKADKNAQVVASVAGEKVVTAKVSELKNDTISVPVTARQMTDEIKLEVKSGEVALDTYKTSVRKIADIYLNNPEKYAKEQKIVKAMLAYGGKMQTYKNYKTEDLADKNITVDLESAKAYIDSYQSSKSNTTGVKVRPSLQLYSQLAVGFYFPTSKVEGWIFKNGENALKTEVKGDYTYVEIGGINPQNLNKNVTLTVDGHNSVEYSPMDYAKEMVESEDVNLSNVVKAMSLYNQAAVAYTNAAK